MSKEDNQSQAIFQKDLKSGLDIHNARTESEAILASISTFIKVIRDLEDNNSLTNARVLGYGSWINESDLLEI